jgi:hypothetical protein
MKRNRDEIRKHLEETREKIHEVLKEAEGVEIDYDAYGDEGIVLRYFDPEREVSFYYQDEIPLEP